MTNIGDSLHGNGHHRRGYSYPLVAPRLEEVHDDGTIVQSTGVERSLAQPHGVMSNPPCFRHMSGGDKNKAVTNIGDNKAETGSGNFIHDDSHHIGDNKAETGSGNCIHDDSHQGAYNKAKAETGSGDGIHDDSHHGALHVKTETGNGDGIHDDSHQGAHNKAKAETGSGSCIHDDFHHGLLAKDLTKADL